MFHISDESERALLEAAAKGQLEVMKELLSKNPNLINATDGDHYTPLHRACYSNQVDIVKYLVEQGADLAALTELKWQPLHCCSYWGYADCAAVLLENGADPNALTEGGMYISSNLLICINFTFFAINIPIFKIIVICSKWRVFFVEFS